MSFLILSFILTIALFNVVSSLSMLMIEKQEDVSMLRSMGANDSLIRRIFLYEGSMIPTLGALIGIVIGVILCLIQQAFGIIKLGGFEGAFVSNNYPVSVSPVDLLLVLMTVCTIGVLASWYPVRYLGKNWLSQGRIAILLLPFLFYGCQNTQTDKSSVVVTIEPQRYFAEKIAGEHFDVYTIVPVGQSPESYDPAPHEMIHITQSKAYLQIGRIGFEQAWMQTIRQNNPHLKYFDLSEGVHWIRDENPHEHEGDTEEAEEASAHHHHGGIDPHIWSATGMAKIIAFNTLQAFLDLDSENKTTYQDNYEQLIEEIDETALRLHSMLDTLTCRTFVIYHPALTYFADEFALTQLAIESEGKEPSVASLKKLIDEAKKAQVRVVFIQHEFDRKHAEQVAAEIGARTVVINPLDRQWNEQMINMAKELIR
jgi:zinc transport system substrate-binding protein